MFTGIVEEMGAVRAVTPHATGVRFGFDARTVLEDAQIGGSIAVNGCCLTVVVLGEGCWEADAVEETLRRTALGELQTGSRVNLERPVRLMDRLGGHLVQGHVDAVGTVERLEREADDSLRIAIAVAPEVLRYVVEKGSISVDGVSLTVAAVGRAHFSVALIPHTQSVTTLGTKLVGNRVNLETDVLAKYVERLMPPVRTEAAVGGGEV